MRFEEYHSHIGDWTKKEYGAKVAFIAHIANPEELIEAFGLTGVIPKKSTEYKIDNPNAFITPSMHGTIYCRKSFEGMQQQWAQYLEDFKLAVIRIHKWSMSDPATSVLPALMHEAKRLGRYGITPIPSLKEMVKPEYETIPLHEQKILQAVRKH